MFNCVTQKVQTPFGSLFVHADFTGDGHLVAIAFSQPQKFERTEIGKLLEVVMEALNALIDENGEDGRDRSAAILAFPPE